MGLIRFRVSDRRLLPADAVDRAYFTGLDEIPWRSRTQWTDEGISLRRVEEDSGNFHIPWIVSGVGEVSLQTGCLMERDEPYLLAVELARGTVNRIRNQLAVWQTAGVSIADRPALLVEALELLSKAATSQNEPAKAEQLAQQVLTTAQDLVSQLCRAYSENAAAARRRQQTRPATAFGVNLGSMAFGEAVGRYVLNTFNAAVVPFSWSDIEQTEGKPDWTLSDKQVEWSRANNLRILSAPLLSFDRLGLPPWLFLYEGDTEAVVSYVENHLRTLVSRYKGRVHLWQVAARLNVSGTLELAEEERLRLAALAIETVRNIDGRVPVTVVIDQPWAEFMRDQDCDFSPLHFADALVRADIGLSGIGLEINLGYASEATQPRDAIDFIRQIDRWSSLGLPLTISLAMPSSADADAKSRARVQTLVAPAGEAMDQLQARYVEQLIPLLLAKPSVQGVLWSQLLDAAPHELPNAGLFDMANQSKPVANALRDVRQRFLG
jgi:hypothetical protein